MNEVGKQSAAKASHSTTKHVLACAVNAHPHKPTAAKGRLVPTGTWPHTVIRQRGGSTILQGRTLSTGQRIKPEKQGKKKDGRGRAPKVRSPAQRPDLRGSPNHLRKGGWSPEVSWGLQISSALCPYMRPLLRLRDSVPHVVAVRLRLQRLQHVAESVLVDEAAVQNRGGFNLGAQRDMGGSK